VNPKPLFNGIDISILRSWGYGVCRNCQALWSGGEIQTASELLSAQVRWPSRSGKIGPRRLEQSPAWAPQVQLGKLWH
jgi:hypothetical protein